MISCETSVKNETPLEFAQTLFQSVKNNDFELAKKILIESNDSNFVTSVKMKKGISKNLGTDSLRQKYFTYVKERFDEAFSKGQESGIDWSKSEFQRFEFQEEYDEKDSISRLENSIIYFSCNSRDYKLKFRKTMKIGSKWKNFKIYAPIDILKEEEEEIKKKEELAKQPYTPWELSFTSCNWNYKYSNIKSFSDFHVTLKNGTEDNFEYVKYSVTIYKLKNGYKDEVFSRTFERHEKIYAGDVIRFEIQDLRDYYIGIDVSNKDNFDWDAVIKDAKPRP